MNDNRKFQFVDTNVLAYAYDRLSGEKQTRAKALLGDLWSTRTGCLSIQVLQEFYVTVTQKISEPLSASEASYIIADFEQWRIHSPTVTDVLGAIQIQQRYQVSFWDALIVRSAAQLDCHTIWSEDLNAGQRYIDIHLQNPFETE